MAFTPVASQLRLSFPDPIGVDQLKRKNALTDQQMQLAAGEHELSKQRAGLDQRRQLLDERQFGYAQQRDKQADSKEWVFSAFSHATKNPAVIPQMIAHGKRAGHLPPDFPDQIEPDDLQQLAVMLGVPRETPFEESPEARAARLRHELSLREIGAREASERRVMGYEDRLRAANDAAARAHALRLQQMKADSAGAGSHQLSKADSTKARLKLNAIDVAKRQLDTVRAAFEPLRETYSAGPLGQMLPTPHGQSFDRAVDAMRASIASLRRVPGVGAMSDYETKLDQLQFPNRGQYEQVTEQQIAQLEDLIATMEIGYRELLGEDVTPLIEARGAPPAPAAAASAPSADAPLTAEEQAELEQLRKKYGR